MTENKNPFLKPYNTPHDTAPFHLIKIEHYEPALLEGMKEQNEEIDAIVNNPEAPTCKIPGRYLLGQLGNHAFAKDEACRIVKDKIIHN